MVSSKGRNGFRVSVAAGIVGLMILGVAAATAPAATLPDVTVKYGDLDLNTAKGAQALYARISSAAQQVCPADSLELTLHLSAVHCQQALVARAVAKVSSPQLAAIYAERVRHGAV